MTTDVLAAGLPSGQRRTESTSRPAPAGIVCVLTVHPAFDIRIFQKQCRTLASSGFDVSLIVPHTRSEVVEGVRIIALPRPQGRFARMTVGVFRILRAAWHVDADVYHLHDPELIPIGLFLLTMGQRVIYDSHEDLPEEMLSKHYVPRRLRRPLAWLADIMVRCVGRCCTAVVAATPAIARRFEGARRPPVVVQNFPSLAEFEVLPSRPWAQRPRAVAYVGGINEIRGMVEMVEAMGLLPEELTATLEVAGVIDSDRLRRRLEALRGWRRVNDLGYLPRTQVAALLGNVRAGLVLFHPEPNHVVAYPTKMFEYMAAGLPVIASDFPLWRRIIEDAGCGILVDPLDVKAVSEAIRWILTHDDEAEAMGRAGQETVAKRYNWEAEAPKLLSLYGDIGG